MKIVFGGGINENQAPHISEAAEGSYNFILSKDYYALRPRKCFDLDGTATNTGTINGIMQLIKRDDTETTLIQSDEEVYKWDGASVFSSMGTVNTSSRLRETYWSLGDYLVITDLEKLTPIRKWDGSSLTSHTTTGLGTELYAKYGVVHKNRVWLFNVKTSSDTPHLMVASAFEDPTSYSTTLRASDTSVTTGLEAFYMLTPDLRPINGAVLFNKELIISSEGGKLFRLVGSSGKDFEWVEYYPASDGIGVESMVNIGNDVMYMKRGGGVDLLSAVQQSSDISADDVSRWISETTKTLTDAIAVYDQVRQRVLFFVTDKVLVFHKDIFYGGGMLNDRGEKERVSPWSIFKTQDASMFNTQCARYIRRPGGTTYTVYFGDDAGRIFDLDGDGLSGDAGSSAIQVVHIKRPIDKRDDYKGIRSVNKWKVRYVRLGEVLLNVEMKFTESNHTSLATIQLDGYTAATVQTFFGGPVYFGDTTYFAQGDAFQKVVSHKNFDNVGKGDEWILTVSTESDLQYQVDFLESR